MTKFRLLALAVLLAGLVAAGLIRFLQPDSSDRELPPGQGDGRQAGLFQDMTLESGIRFSYRNGEEAGHYVILESLGGGVGLIDYDGDGLLDIFLTGGGSFDKTDAEYKKDPNHPPRLRANPCKLYRNQGNFKFEDVTAQVGLDKIDFFTHGVAVADYDRDGYPDLLVTGYGRVALFKNVPGGDGRRFQEVTRKAGLDGPHIWATSAAWGDLNGDGYPDLYICQYVDWSWDNNPPCGGYSQSVPRDICSPRQFNAMAHRLYRNNGNGTFTDVGLEAGLRMPRKPADYDRLAHLGKFAKQRLQESAREGEFGKGLGVIMVDLDGDGRPEIYVANDTTEKFLYLNRGKNTKLLLEEAAANFGVDVDDQGLANGSMGVDAGDYDGSGRPSLLVTNYENELHALYRNISTKKRLNFENGTFSAGIASLGRSYVGFGVGFFDLDNDGWLDVFISNGHVIRHPTASGVRQRPVLLRNQGKRKGEKQVQLVNITDQGGAYFRADHQGRGAAIGDLDNDGWPDLVISHVNDRVVLLRNRAADKNHWLGIELVGADHADVLGARLTLEVDGRTLTQFTKAGGSYLSSGDRRFIFGLGKASKAGRLTVTWPSGEQQHWDPPAVDRYWIAKKGVEDLLKRK